MRSAAAEALRYPSMTSDAWTPMRRRFSACDRSSPARRVGGAGWARGGRSGGGSGRAAPANVMTKLVPSPISCSCIFAAIVSIRAAGCATSSSCTMVAASEVTKIFSRWLTTSFFIAFGPRDVRVMTASPRQASMLRTIASSRPEKCL